MNGQLLLWIITDGNNEIFILFLLMEIEAGLNHKWMTTMFAVVLRSPKWPQLCWGKNFWFKNNFHRVYIYYIINFIKADQSPRAYKIMFYTADKKVN